MVYFLLENKRLGPKRQTLSNQGAQSRASVKMDRQITEDRKLKGKIPGENVPRIFFYEN
jgi:hypothetical protein